MEKLPPSIRAIVQRYLDRHKLPWKEFSSRSRLARVTHIRQDVWREIYDSNKKIYPMTRIAGLFGYDHSTISHGIAKSRERAQKNISWDVYGLLANLS